MGILSVQLFKESDFDSNIGKCKKEKKSWEKGKWEELLVELKKEDLHICLETCGYFNLDQFKSNILPSLDLIYFDLKIFDSEQHKEYCGVTNDLILKNFEDLLENSNVEILPRIPLVP